METMGAWICVFWADVVLQKTGTQRQMLPSEYKSSPSFGTRDYIVVQLRLPQNGGTKVQITIPKNFGERNFYRPKLYLCPSTPHF